MSEDIKPEELLDKIDHRPPGTDWMDTPTQIRPGMYCYAAKPESLETLSMPNARNWDPKEEDWKLPENWQLSLIHI